MRIPSILLNAVLVGVGLVVVPAGFAAQENWSQFRGPNGQGVALRARPPVEFGPDRNAIWRVPVSEGHSSPSIWGDRIFLTSYSEGELACEGYDRRTGERLWRRPIATSEIEQTHRFSNPAAPTPVADAERVIAYFGSFGLVCYDHEGVEQWRLPLPAPESRGGYGSASSPVLVDGLVIQTLDSQEGKSRLIAVDCARGEIQWEVPRPLFSASWSTPVLCSSEGHRDLMVLGSKQLVAYDPKSGEERWSVGGFPGEVIGVPAIGPGVIFAGGAGLGGRSNRKFEGMRWSEVSRFDKDANGAIEASEVPEDYQVVQRPELPEGHPGRRLPWPLRTLLDGMDEDKDGQVTEEEWTAKLADFESRDVPILAAVKTDLSASSDAPRIAWSYGRGIPEIPSPLFYQGRVFLIRDGGLMQCLEASSGSLIYNERVGVSGGFCASPVAADGRIYVASHSGSIVVVDARSEEFAVLARNDLGEVITATPAIVGDNLYVRTATHLYAFGTEDKGGGDTLLGLDGAGATDANLAARN